MNDNPCRIAVTGFGVVSGVGLDSTSFWTALVEGRSGIKSLTPLLSDFVPDAALRMKSGAYITDFDPALHFDDRQASTLDRGAQYLLVAGREAAAQAQLSREFGRRTAVIVGSAIGGMSSLDDGYRRLYFDRRQKLPPLTVPKVMASSGASHLSMDLGVTGPTFSIASACASSAHAVGTAVSMIRLGVCDVAVTGGAEACFAYGELKAWDALRVVAEEQCRPFDANRQGMILGEGAGVIVLERMDHAVARGATVHAEVIGFGMSADAGDLVHPDAEGMAAALSLALRDAGLEPREVDYINAHGTGTVTNDIMETKALRMVFGKHADRLAVSSTKPAHGHALGASSALELVTTILSLRNGVAPPTLNLTTPDPACDLDYVPLVARQGCFRVALCSSFAFGGLNSVIALRRMS